jgi:hypothetical protein
MYGRLLAGPLIGSFLFVDDSDAAKGVADGWLEDMAGAAYPFPWQRGTPEIAPPQSYTDWADAGFPFADQTTPPEPPPDVVVNFTALTNTNPAVMTIATVQFDLLKDGDVVKLGDSGHPAIDGKTSAIANGNATSLTFDLTELDLSAQPAPIGGGTATVVTAPTKRTTKK